MRRRFLIRLPATALALALATGCAGLQEAAGNAPKTAIGGLGGALAGGLLGAALDDGGTRGIAAGTAVGALLGALGGNMLDQRDRRIANETAQRAMESVPTGQAMPWTNPDTGNSGTITPTRTWHAPSGRYCREFQQEIVIGGKRQQGFGTACRQGDGSWQIQS